MKKINPYFLSLLSALALILFTSGCYTILNHPRVETEPQKDYEYYSCSDCHGQNAYFGYYHTPLAYPRMWHDYYIQPWWYSEIDNTGEQDIPTRSIIGDREIQFKDDSITIPANIRGGSSTAREVRETDTNSGSTKDNRIKRIKRSERKARDSSRTKNNNDSRDNNKDRSDDNNRR